MKIFTIFFTLLFTLQLSAQDPLLQKPNETLDVIATTITKKYDDQLGLDGSQFIKFQKIVEEYLIREENIHNEFSGKEKLDLLFRLRKAESKEIRNVLTQPQYNLYIKLKPQFQPLAKIDVADDNDDTNE
ncbi:hypothetical protein [Winogradskyella sp.]|uniref:hypothetical protein n=1 Tax=Winogradskyella sp. TaxID=1883156 RepID=UPI003F6D3552